MLSHNPTGVCFGACAPPCKHCGSADAGRVWLGPRGSGVPGFLGMGFMGFEIALNFTGFPVRSTAALLKLFGNHSPNNALEQSANT